MHNNLNNNSLFSRIQQAFKLMREKAEWLVKQLSKHTMQGIATITRDEHKNEKFHAFYNAMHINIPRAYNVMYYTIASLIIVFFLWAMIFNIDAYVMGKGKVGTFSRVNTILSSETSIISKVLVTEGQNVKKGDIILTFDKEAMAAQLKGLEENFYNNLASIARIQALINNKDLELPPEIAKFSSNLAYNAQLRYNSDKASYLSGLNVLKEQMSQRESELTKLQEKHQFLQKKLSVAEQQATILDKLEQKELVSKFKVLDNEKELLEYQQQFEAIDNDESALKASLAEIKSGIDQYESKFKNDMNNELEKRRSDDARLRASLVEVRERVQRAEVTAPVDGVVLKIPNITLSSSIPAGQEIASIVPHDDGMIIEANVRPEDIGFININQSATVKITAFDYSIYGALRGNVLSISPETMTDPVDNKPYFKVKIQTDKNYLDFKGHKHYISPGMLAIVDIKIDSRTVAQYIFNPIIKSVRESMRER